MQYASSSCQQLNQFYKANKDKARAKSSDLMYTATNKENEVCSVLRLLPYDDFLFLRSVLTAQENRGAGIASDLIKYAIQQHNEPIYTLPTPQALSLYERLGFQSISTPDIPAQLLASYRRFRHSHNGPTVMAINLPLR